MARDHTRTLERVVFHKKVKMFSINRCSKCRKNYLFLLMHQTQLNAEVIRNESFSMRKMKLRGKANLVIA